MRTSPFRGSHLVVAAGVLVLAACGDDPVDESNEPDRAEADYVLLLDDDSDPDQVEGEAGRYALTARGDGAPSLAVLDVPAGYANFGEFAVWTGEDSGEPFRAVQYWTVNGVFADPCDGDGPAPEAGTTVQDLADALVAQQRTVVSDPVPVSLDDHDGLYVELRVPSRVDFATCTKGYYLVWEGMPGDAQHSAESPGTVERVWILDVDGERVALVASAAPRVPDTRVEELTAMVESVDFVEPG